MPKYVAEITSGVTFDYTSEERSVAATTNRVFRIIKEAPSESINLQEACGIRIGEMHPFEGQLFCTAFSGQYEADSRMVILATFTYRFSAQSREEPPDARPANWSVSTSLVETPAYVWKGITGPTAGTIGPIANPAGDMYEGVTRLEPIVTIAVEQFEVDDPTRHCLFAGCVNSDGFTVGSLSCPPRSVMFRGVQTTPAVDSWGGDQYRGWKASYEFAYRRNFVGNPVNDEIGWDWAQPQVGFNVKAFAPPGVQPAGGDLRDVYGQILRHRDGRIADPLQLPTGVNAGDKVRACIRIFEREDGGATQRPSAQPIAINNDGTPRRDTANPPVLVYRYQVQPDVNFSNFGLRLT
jgi:hypothetical protein